MTTDNKLSTVKIPGIEYLVVNRYFESFNDNDFDTTVSLFTTEGVLNAPFEDPIIGREAIAYYLQTEAQGMQAYPQEGVSQQLDDFNVEVKVSGKVKTPLFWVNVAWQFILNSQHDKIIVVTVKLLASPQELLNLRSHTKFDNGEN
ncbi:MAG: nuclear transport factor 2 family protein [Microcoleaceae cyanobacterium MO_207.B10]|nr:nuclear transport factor 2 family protein [Microcoleaceae cyanobacterium MO_207.B10]